VINRVGVVATAVSLLVSAQAAWMSVAPDPMTESNAHDSALEKSHPPDEFGRPYSQQIRRSVERACKQHRRCWTPERRSKMPAVRRQFAKRTRSHLPPRASRAALGKDSSPFYYSCHITERMCSCSNFVVDTNWYGMTVQMNFDRYETRKVARADDFGYYVQSITTGSALVTTITKSISRGGLTGVAFLAFVASVWAIITHQAQDALDDGGSLRLTIHYTFIPVPIAWFTTDTI
jgi:hypothetical protein